MTPLPPTAWRAVWLLTRLRLQRLLNVSGRGFSFKKNNKSRPATPGKRGGRWLLDIAARAHAVFLRQHRPP